MPYQTSTALCKKAAECLLDKVKELEGSVVEEAHRKRKDLDNIGDIARGDFTTRAQEAEERIKAAHDVISKLEKSNSSAKDLHKTCENEIVSVQRKLETMQKEIQEKLSETLAAIKEANKVTNQLCFYRCRRIELDHVQNDTQKRTKACKEELPHTTQAWKNVQAEIETCHDQVRVTIKKHADGITQHMTVYTEESDLTCRAAIAILDKLDQELEQEHIYLETSIEGVDAEIKKMRPGEIDTRAAHDFQKGEKKRYREKLCTELTEWKEAQDYLNRLRKKAPDTNHKCSYRDCPAYENKSAPTMAEAEASYEIFELWQRFASKKRPSSTAVSDNAIKEAMDKMAEKFATELNKLSIEMHMLKQQNREMSEQLSKDHDYEPSLLSIAPRPFDEPILESEGKDSRTSASSST